MPKLPRISSDVVIRALTRAGFYRHHQTGSHLHLRHSEQTELRIVIPAKKKGVAPKTLKTILTQARITVDQFIELL